MIILPGIVVQAKIYESEKSIVYRGIYEQKQIPAILKVLKSDYPSVAELNQYKQEYEITQQLKLPGVIKAYSLEKYQNTLVMILEDFGGESLKRLVKSSQKITLVEFLEIAIKLTEIIGEIHAANIIHKDINPSNIVYNRETEQIKLIDFGIATILSRQNPTLNNPNLLEGTLAYISPEQTGRMNRSLDYRTDFYSLGVTFYELLTNQLPFKTTDPIELVHCHIAKQPIPPHEIDSDIPQDISAIIMKLLAKNPEDRYQSAWGIQADLVMCLMQLEANGEIEDIIPGQNDIYDKFEIPQKLYGREQAVKTLLAAFERVAGGEGKSPQSKIELMLVTGYSGIGKSALVQEIYQAIAKKRGYFLTGKFDPLKRNIPYSGIVSAFQGLVRQLLTESEGQLQQWREKLLAALHQQGQVIIDAIPELELIIGKQPAVPELSSIESQNRFIFAFQNFIRVFCQPEHPLVIFLDDLHWTDTATLKLIKLIVTDIALQYLLLIGAYQEQEFNPNHPVKLAVNQLGKKRVTINQITLEPLSLKSVTQLIADTLHSPTEAVKELAKLVHRKTEGNPFFVNEFLKQIYAENLLVFDLDCLNWRWDMAKIAAMNITDNVVELLIDKLKKLPESTQNILRLAACVGTNFDLNTLSIICHKLPREVVQDLVIAVEWGLIQPEQDYKFTHDRVQQAAYNSIDQTQKTAVHLQIGRLLLQNSPPETLSDKIFEIVPHLNLGIGVWRDLSLPDGKERQAIPEGKERQARTPIPLNEIAFLNLIAGQKALAASAYGVASKYLNAGIELLAKNSWLLAYDLTLALYESAVEAAYLNGDFQQQSKLTEVVLQKAKTQLDKVKVSQVKIKACIAQTQLPEAVEIAWQTVSLLGVNIPKQPSRADLDEALLETAAKLTGKEFLDLIELPPMSEPIALAVMRLLASANAAAYTANPQLLPLIISQQVNLSLEYGNADVSPLSYAYYGAILCGSVVSIESGYKFGQVALKLLDKLDNKQVLSRTLDLVYGTIQGWKFHLKSTLKPLHNAYEIGKDNGCFEYAGYSIVKYCYYSFLTGQPLNELEQEMKTYSEVLEQHKQLTAVNYLERDRQAILNLIEGSLLPGVLTGKVYDEWEKLPIYEQANDYYGLLFLYLNKLILSYLFEEYSQAIAYANLAETYLDGGTGLALVAVFYFYDSLARLMVYPELASEEQAKIIKKVNVNQKKMKYWANIAPMNYLHKYDLVEAERHRVLGQYLEAMDYCDRAIAGAKKNEYIQEEALSNELAAKLYLSRRKEKIAQVYMRDACYCYTCWGSQAKVKKLSDKYPHLITENWTKNSVKYSITSHITTSTSSTEILDIATVIKASQAIYGEIVLEKLLAKLMKIMLENAAAQVGYLILHSQADPANDSGQLLIEASGSVDNENIAVLQSIPVENCLPVSVINYVARTKEIVVNHDAANMGRFTDDPYIKTYQSKSILCAPIINKGQLSGAIYLENNLTTGAFTSDRIEVINLITAQAAISIENALLYSNLQHTKQQLEHYSRTLEVKVKERTQELATAKKSAEAASLAKTEFLSNMSHELRTPLNGILGYTQILQRDSSLKNKQKEAINIIHQCGGHLLTLINDILDLSKIEAGKMELCPSEIDFDFFLQCVVEICRIKAETKNISFTYQPSKQLPKSIYTDEKRLRQVLINLLGNAIKFTEEGGVTFKVEVIGNAANDNQLPIPDYPLPICQIRFLIQDTGVGMSESEIAQIFLPFERVGDRARLVEGTGLGLAISQKIVNMMGSTINVKSQLGEGSTFWIDLDLPVIVGSTKSSQSKHNEMIIGYEGKQQKILVVDDKWQNRAVLRNMLEPLGFIIAEAANGEEGIEIARALQPNLIIIDLVMPVLDGFEMMRQLRRLPEFQAVPIIACSASVYNIDRQKSIQAGSNDFLSKPVVLENLLEKLQLHLGLEWIYEQKNPQLPPEIENAHQIATIVPPPPEALARLYDLVRQGLIFEVEEEASRLEQENEEFVPFCRKILQFAQDFEVEKILNFLESYINPG
ncbi:AAA family ATPase [Microseira sp. BLCC-F43]|jgi:predicted ATPase/signal transduction histidine kinase/DNA-binding NarL/FixJ family response regulator|uniref:hybrid sensor histidine kinase/response regulator n=1 Tax=Microseira sp. BLCC-F43 TaxID=3153602 RepID=UPI0035B92E83